MRLRLTWGDGASYETADFGIEHADAVKLCVRVENDLKDREAEWPLKMTLVGGTIAVKWFWEQLNPLGRNFQFHSQEQLDDMIHWLTDVYREGITEAAVLVNYFRSLERRSRTYSDLQTYRRAAAQGNGTLLAAVEASDYREALVQAKIKRYEDAFPPVDPNEKADTEPVVNVIRYENRYVVTDRVEV